MYQPYCAIFTLLSCASQTTTTKGAEEKPVNQDLRIEANSYGLDKFTQEQFTGFYFFLANIPTAYHNDKV